MRIVVKVALLLAVVMDASAQRLGGIIGRPPQHGPSGPNRLVSPPFSLGARSGKGSRLPRSISLYYAPYPVYAGDGSYSAAVGAEPDDTAEAAATPYVGVSGPYVDTRGPYVDSRGPYGETDTYPPEAANFVGVPQDPVAIPAEDRNIAESPPHNSDVRTEPNVRATAIDNSEALPRFWIGLKNRSVYSATAYWTEGETLHYITPQGTHNQVSLRLVDWGPSAGLDGHRPAFPPLLPSATPTTSESNVVCRMLPSR